MINIKSKNINIKSKNINFLLILVNVNSEVFIKTVTQMAFAILLKWWSYAQDLIKYQAKYLLLYVLECPFELKPFTQAGFVDSIVIPWYF